MSNTKTSTTSGGIGLPTILGVTFITLKLTNYIDWSWWWVLSPFWIPVALLLAAFLVIIAFLGIKEILD
jgi:hypothetical protein